MKTRKTTLIAVLAASAALAGIAAPAAAQGYGYDRQESARHYDGRDDRNYDRGRWDGDRGAYNIDQRQQRLAWRIERGVRSGALSQREARDLRAGAYDIARLEARYRRDGLSGWERADLDRRLDRLDAQVRYERRDRDYGSGYYR